jgi:hypothetical protein
MATQQNLLGAFSLLEGIEDKLYPIKPNPNPQTGRILREIASNLSETKAAGGYVTSPGEVVDEFLKNWIPGHSKGPSLRGADVVAPPYALHHLSGNPMETHHFLQFKFPFKGKYKGMTFEEMLNTPGGRRELDKISSVHSKMKGKSARKELVWGKKGARKKLKLHPALVKGAKEALKWDDARSKFLGLSNLGMTEGKGKLIPRTLAGFRSAEDLKEIAELSRMFGVPINDEYNTLNIAGRQRQPISTLLDVLTPKTKLYHMTRSKNLSSILEQGLIPYKELRDAGAFLWQDKAIPLKRAGKDFGPFFSLNKPVMDKLPGGGTGRWDHYKIFETTAEELKKAGVLPREEISRLLSGTGISGEIQAGGKVPAGILRNMKLRGGQLMPLMLVGLLASLFMGED